MVKKLMHKISKKAGLSPGAMVHIGEQKVEKETMYVIDYDQKDINLKELKSVKEAFPFKDSPTVSWLNVSGLHNVNLLEELGVHFSIHPLVLEDILNTEHRPKVEFYDDYIFVIFKMITYDNAKDETDTEQVSLILGKHFVITFQEKEGDIFDPVRQRIKNINSRLRKHGPDYLAYALLDVVVDNYYFILEKYGEIIEKLEEKVLVDPDRSMVKDIQGMKRETMVLRKSLWPMRETINNLLKEDTPLITDFTILYLRDLYDHSIQAVDTVEIFRDMVSGIMDVYLSSLSTRMNEVMKVLTIMASIFIPLTFIAGVYGMNFENMPELHWSMGYPFIWGLMLTVSIILIIFFKRRKWL